MYLCEGQRQELYLKSRKLDEANEERQQDVVDAENAERLGYEVQAKNLSRLAKSVFNEITATNPPVATIKGMKQLTPVQQFVSLGNTIYDIIKNGKLTEFTQRLKSIGPEQKKKLSKGAKIVLKDITEDPDTKKIINEEISNIISKALPKADEAEEIKKVLVDVGAGGKKELLEELLSVVNQRSKKDPEQTPGSYASTAASTWVDSFIANDAPYPVGITNILNSYEEKNKSDVAKIYKQSIEELLENDEKNLTATNLSKKDYLEYAIKILPNANKEYIKAQYEDKVPVKQTNDLMKSILRTAQFKELTGIDI